MVFREQDNLFYTGISYISVRKHDGWGGQRSQSAGGGDEVKVYLLVLLISISGFQGKQVFQTSSDLQDIVPCMLGQTLWSLDEKWVYEVCLFLNQETSSPPRGSL